MPHIYGLDDARRNGQVLFDNIGEEWYYYNGKIRMTGAALEAPDEQEENGYWCEWEDARDLLIEFGYIN